MTYCSVIVMSARLKPALLCLHRIHTTHLDCWNSNIANIQHLYFNQSQNRQLELILIIRITIRPPSSQLRLKADLDLTNLIITLNIISSTSWCAVMDLMDRWLGLIQVKTNVSINADEIFSRGEVDGVCSSVLQSDQFLYNSQTAPSSSQLVLLLLVGRTMTDQWQHSDDMELTRRLDRLRAHLLTEVCTVQVISVLSIVTSLATIITYLLLLGDWQSWDLLADYVLHWMVDNNLDVTVRNFW